MFRILRRHTKFVIWAVVISFALWGGSSIAISWQKEARFAGEVFGRPVSHREFDSALKAMQIFVTPETPEDLEEAAWEHIALVHESRRRNLSVSDEEVRAEIRRLFEREGSPFEPQLYRRWVKSVFREEPRLFEEQVREVLLKLKLRAVILAEKGVGIEEKEATPLFQNWSRELLQKARPEGEEVTR